MTTGQRVLATRLFATRLFAIALIAAAQLPMATTGLAQDATARAAWQEGRRLALDGQPDSALVLYTRAVATARSTGDRAIGSAAQRGLADIQLVYRGCVDDARKILIEAVADASEGDRSAADALVRLLAAHGDVAGARSTLVKAYADIPSIGRKITRESVNFLLGMAIIERFSGHESAALSTLNSALQIAVRMHEGDVKDNSDHAVGTITAENVWVMFDLAQLRLHAKSPGIASARDGARIMDLLAEAWPTVSDHGQAELPVSRLGDRLLIKAHGCIRSGTPCPAPKPPNPPKC